MITEPPKVLPDCSHSFSPRVESPGKITIIAAREKKYGINQVLGCYKLILIISFSNHGYSPAGFNPIKQNLKHPQPAFAYNRRGAHDGNFHSARIDRKSTRLNSS